MRKRMRRTGIAVASLAGVIALAPAAYAGAFTQTPLVQVSGASPLAACLGDQPDSGTNFVHSEVEPWVQVSPADPEVMIGAWQQDRWSNGGARGLVTATSVNGGDTWTLNANTKSSICTGGTAANGGNYERASDPWVTISPDGTAYLMSLSVDTNDGGFGTYPNAMLVSRSTDNGLTWSDPITLRRDTNPNVLNDKNTMTADPHDSDFVYAIWDRLVAPPGEPPSPLAGENAIGYRGPTYFTRTTDGGQTWEEARVIFDPGTLNQTIGNQIVVTSSGTLVNAFDLIYNFKNAKGVRGFNVSILRSTDKGATWDDEPTIVAKHHVRTVVDPDTGDPLRTGNILPEVAADPNSDDVYLVWEEAQGGTTVIYYAQSPDAGTTWSTPIKVNQSPGNTQAFVPMVRVLDDGTVGVFYYDLRNNTPDPATLPTDAFVVHCHPATENCADPASWGDEIQLTDTSFDMRQMPVARGFFPGDYVGFGSTGTEFVPFFSASHAGDPASVFTRRVGP